MLNGVAWRNIADCGCSYSSCWRYLNEIQRRGDLQLIYEALAEDRTDTEEGAIDTTTVTSFRFQLMTGWDGKHKKIGTKVSLFTDSVGLPIDVGFGKGSTHDLRFVSAHLEKTVGRRTRILNLDKGYTSVKLRRELRQCGIYVNMQTRCGDYIRKRGPKFKFDEEKYQVRFLVERTNGWLKSFRRLRLRRERRPAMFKAFVYLALIIILLRNSDF